MDTTELNHLDPLVIKVAEEEILDLINAGFSPIAAAQMFRRRHAGEYTLRAVVALLDRVAPNRKRYR